MFLRELWHDLFSPRSSWHGGSNGWSRGGPHWTFLALPGDWFVLELGLTNPRALFWFYILGLSWKKAISPMVIGEIPLDVFSQRWTGHFKWREPRKQRPEGRKPRCVKQCVQSQAETDQPAEVAEVTLWGPCLAVGTRSLGNSLVSRESQAAWITISDPTY